MSVLFGPGDTTGLSPAEVTFDGSTSTVAWPSSSSRAGADGADVCMPAGVGMSTLKDTSGYFGKARDRESVRERFAPSAGGSPGSPTLRGAGGHLDAKNQRDPERASPRGQLAASRAQAEQLRDEVAQLHHLLHQTRELHASEASRLHFQLQESKTTARREQGLREEAELREKAKSSQCDQLQKEIGALKQQLTKRHIHIGGSSQGNSPLNSLKGEDLKQLGTELQQIRQDSQELRDLMAKQHDEELQRLREDLEQTQQSSRKAHHAVSKLEAAQKQQSISDQAATRKLEDRCLQLEHYTEIAEAKRMAATEELRAMEAAYQKLDQEMHQEQAAARQAHTQLEQLSLEQKSMILDQALQEEAQERASQLTKRFAASEVQREDLERQLRQERHQLHLVQKQLDATALYHDRAQERICALEASAKSADLQQAVECASFWTEQDALRRSQRQTAISEERARQLQFEVKSLECQQEHTRQLQLQVEKLESKEEAAEQAQLELKDQHSMAESKVSQLQDAVSFLQQRVTQNAGTDAKLSEIQMMFRKVLNRYKKLLASSADTHISTVTCESKLSEMEMLMRGVEEEQDALISLQEQQQLNLASAETREKALQSEAAEEMRESIGLRALLRSAELRSDTQESALQRLMEDVAELGTDRERHIENLGSSKRAVQELQQEIYSLQDRLQSSSSLSEAHLGAHMRAENQAQSLQKKWLDEHLQCQAAEAQLLQCQYRLEQEEQLAKELDAKERRQREFSEEAQDALRKLQIQNQRLELKVASNLRSMGQEEEAMKGMQQALEEAHQELHTLRAEQQSHLADSVGAKVRVRAATESFEAMCQERAELHEELHDTKLRFCNSQLEHAAEKTEGMAARGSLKQLEMKLQAALRSEQQYLQDFQQQTQALQRVEASEKALTAQLLQVEAELDNCEATRANELSVQHSKLQYEEAHVKDLQSALASLQAEHEGLLWQFQVERAQSEDRYQDLTKEVHELRTQEMELKLKVAHTDDLHNLLSKRTEESVYELQKARDELSVCQGHLQAEEEELRRLRTEEAELRSRDTVLVQLQNQETERARRSDWLREESEERLASAFQMTQRLQQSLDSANEALKTSVQSQHSKDELYTNLLKDYRSLQDEEQRRQRAQNEFQQRLLEEGARVKALEALKHREEETIEHVSQVLKEASEEHQANSLKYQAQIQEMKTGQEQLLEQVKQETNEQISHLCETNRSLSAECRELLTASREADEMHQGNVQRMQKNLDEMKGHCASCENVADSMRSRAEGLTAQLRLAQDEVKARSVMLAHTEEQAAFQRQQHLLEMKELEDEYAKQAWQADKNELKIQQMMAESSSTAAETVSRIARSQEKEAKAAARAEQLEIILRELRATLAHSQEESIESSKQVLSLEKAHSDFQEKLAENRKITADLEAQIHDLEDQLKLCSTELHESEARHLQQQQQQISQERTRQQAQEMQMEQMQQQCQMTQVQMSEAHDALQAKEKEIRHLEKLQEEDQKRHSSLSSLRDQLDFNCRELNHQIQQLNAVNKEEQKKSTAIQLRLEQVEAEAQYASSEAVQAARQQEFAFETLMARCSASEHSVQQLEETRKQLRAQLAAQSRLRESERYAEQVVAATTAVPAEPPDSDAVRRNLEAKGLELTELEFTLREVELNSDRLQQYLEQSQSNLEMQTEEKIRLEDHYAEKRRQLMDTEAKLREVQGQCSYWKSQHQSEEQRAQQWETKVEDLLRDLQCLQSELAKVQGLPPAEVVLRRDDSRDSRDEIRQLQQELQLLSGQAKEQAQQLEHGRSVQQNLMAARAQLDEGYREAQERLAQAEEDLDELRAQGNSRRSSEARHYQEELLALRTAQTTMEAQSQTREQSAEERVQKLTMDLRHLSQKNNNLLQENQDRKAAALNLEDSIKRLRTDVDYMSTARREEGEMFMHQEDATRHLEIALEVQTQRTEELCSENSNLHSEIEQLERRCRGQEEKSAQTLQGALSIEKQLLAVRAKHGQLQEAYREQRHLRAKEAEDGRASTKGIVDALKEELSQLREEAAAERAVREETDRIQEEVEEKVRRLHSEELQGIHFEHNALRSALHLQRRNSTAALEAQRWALRREKQLRKKRYALLMAASEELRGGLMRLKEATDSAAEADASVEDQDQQVAEELEQVKLAQQVLSDSRAVEQEKMARLDEVQLQLKDERKAATPNQPRIEELLVAERLALEEVEKQEAVVAEDKQHFNEDYKKLEEAHTEERCSRERAEAYHHQVAAETQLLAVDLLKLQGVFEADGESESNFSQGSKGVREGRPLLEVASSEDEEEGSETGEVNPTTDP